MPSLPANIHEVVTELERIMDTCASTRSRLGFFAALYHKVTCRVRDGIVNDEFENGPRMERLDVTFANRYIHAWRQYQAGEKPSASWAEAFSVAHTRKTLVLQHLLLGMNAHINLDLGIAAVEVAQKEGLLTIRKDFMAINGILALLTGDVLNSLRRVSPLMSLLGLHATRYNSILIQFSISNARDGAWGFAEELFDAGGDSYQKAIADRDQNISLLGEGLNHGNGLMRLTLWIIHLFEWKKPARIIAQLRAGTPAMVKVHA